MKVIRIQGGLGNQMFQFALGEAIRSQFACDVKYDVSFFDDQIDYVKSGNNFRTFDLIETFPLVRNHLLVGNTTLKFKQSNYLVDRLIKRMSLYFAYNKLYKYIFDPQSRYKPLDDVIVNHKNVYLSGYWQNKKYFERYFNLSYFLEFDSIITENTLVVALRNEIEFSNSVSIHVRRGDYLKSELFQPVSNDYFLKAINTCNKSLQNPHFYIFSDDVTWLNENISFFKKVADNIKVIPSEDSNCHTDFYLMSQCKHNIITNSTYSWWASYLNHNPDKVVIAPKEWTYFENLNNYVKESLNDKLILI